jgi:hypothetical protein
VKSYGIQTVVGDRYSALFTVEGFSRHEITYLASERTKSEICLEALPLLNSGRLELLDDPRLVSQLVRLERRTARSGKDSVDHPPGSHDDVANAASGALVLVKGAMQDFVASEWLIGTQNTMGDKMGDLYGLNFFDEPMAIRWKTEF